MNYFSFTFFFVVCFALTKVNGLTDSFAENRAACYKKQGLSDGGFSTSGSNLFTNKPEESGNYLACLYNDIGVLNKDGSINLEKSLELVDESIREMARPGITSCTDTAGKSSSADGRSFELTKCFSTGYPPLFAELGILKPPYKL